MKIAFLFNVLCGILKQNLIKMLIGTSPCIINVVSCVTAGACLTVSKDDPNYEVYNSIFNISILISSVFQIGSGILATYYVNEYIGQHKNELEEIENEAI